MGQPGFEEMAQAGFGTRAQAEFENAANPVAELLGGRRVLKHAVATPLDAHELIVAGLPGEALNFLERRLTVLDAMAFEKAIGMSLRTVQRRRADPSQALNPEQSGRTWKFAEILAQATRVFGDQSAAERWLEQPAMALDGRRPLDLLASPAGVELVETLLGQLEFGVYV